MKKLLTQNKFFILFSILLITVWRIFLMLPDFLGGFIYRHPGFIGPVGWANLDGIHYLSISKSGYLLGEKAFFPVYPLLIHILSTYIPILPRLTYAMGISYIALFFLIIFFGKLILLDFPKKTAVWSIVFLLFFPSGFFFGSVYTESLFLLLVLISLYLARKKHFVWASVIAGIASATRIVSIFLLCALLIEYFPTIKHKLKPTLKEWLTGLGMLLFSSSGLLGYMYYCWRTSGDPLRFVHVQSLFGANRTNGKIILLPQVLFRYVKILLTIPYTNHDFWIALLEIITFSVFLIILAVNWKKIRPSYLFFSFAAILLPTLTGTLSSMPRYVLVAFPVFIMLGSIKNTAVKVAILFVFMAVLVVTTAYFLRGYFIA